MKEYPPIDEEIERTAAAIIDAALKVHRTLGPGLLESVYEQCLTYELRSRQLAVELQVPVPVIYEGLRVDGGLKLDMLVEREVIVELKAVELLHPVFEAQILSYLRLANKRLGLLINFNVPILKEGIRRFIR